MSAKWIQGAIKNKGVLKESASKAGALKKDGTIASWWLEKAKKSKGKLGKRARLAETLKSFH